ncbi:hypothetical protein MRB53_021431 [Persea americana]|uniref:Uncharacterized protein n=1 Tax=Persea americana TaxID=3435 RepID=A0ACC2L4Z1_PERAE|nr:hypothetical protein MRB53_021431 [Persea americana]
MNWERGGWRRKGERRGREQEEERDVQVGGAEEEDDGRGRGGMRALGGDMRRMEMREMVGGLCAFLLDRNGESGLRVVRSGAEERKKNVREVRERTRATDDDGEPRVCVQIWESFVLGVFHGRDQRSYDIERPSRKRPWSSSGMQRRCRSVNQVSMQLTFLALSDVVHGV